MRYRIDRPIRGRQGARIIALDARRRRDRRTDSAPAPGADARFFALAEPVGDVGDGGSESVALRGTDGEVSSLLAELEDADVVIMVATTEADAAAATIIGAACTVRGIMTAGPGHRRAHDWSVPRWRRLRPHARVLLVTGDEHDVVDLLTALRA